MADDVGSLLLRSGIVAAEQLDAARQAVKDTGGTVPEQLVRRGYIDDEELTTFYRSRLLIPRVNPSELAKLTTALLNRVPADMASEFRSIPVAVDDEGNLTLIMSDPSDTKAVDEIAFFTGSYIVRAIATQAQIAWCLAHYYKQKTGLYLDLVADGQWPQSTKDQEEGPPDASELSSDKDTAPIPRSRTGPPGKKASKTRRGVTSRDEEDTGETKEIVLEAETGPLRTKRTRPANQQPSPPELFARAGEIQSTSKPERKLDSAPAVVVSLDPAESAVVLDYQRGTDTAPILLSEVKMRLAAQEAAEAAAQAIVDEQSGPIILDQSRRKRRSSRHTELGVGAYGRADSNSPLQQSLVAHSSGPTATAAEEALDNQAGAALTDTDQEDTEVSAPQVEFPRSANMVDDERWGEPGSTIPPAFLGAAPSTYEDVAEGIPTAVEDDVTSEIKKADESVPSYIAPESDETVRSHPPQAVRHTSLAQAASRLLVALRAIDHAESKKAVVASLLDFLDGAFERTGFMALRQDDLVAWLIHGCGDGVAENVHLKMDQASSFKSVVHMRLPYNGPIEDAPTKQLAREIDIPDALDLLALPLMVRERVVGVLFGMGSHGKIFEEHLSVLSQAASEAFETILRNRRS